MTTLRHTALIAAKDLKLFSRDRVALFFSLGFPFLFVSLFSTILSGVASEDERMQLHIVTEEDSTGLSCHIAKAMETDDVEDLDPGEPLIIWDEDYDEAYNHVADGTIGAFLAFPEDFTDGISRGYGTTIEVVADPDNTYERAALKVVGEAIAAKVGLQQVVRSAITALTMETWLNSSDLTHISEELQTILSIQAGVPMRSSLIEYKVDKVGEVEAKEPATYVIPGYLVMFVFLAAASSAELIVRERQNNTLERLLSASVRREAIVVGTFAGTAVKGLIQIALFWTVGLLLFNMNLGLAPGAVILLSILTVIMSSAFAIMLATLVRTQRSASSIATITALVLAPLGGCWWPLFITPRWMQFIAKLTPHGWATTGFNKLLIFGGDLSSVVPEVVALCAFAAAFGIVALVRFRISAV